MESVVPRQAHGPVADVAWPRHAGYLLVVFGLLCSACGGAARLGIGPCVDSRGHPGLDVTLSWGMGPGGATGSLLVSGILGGGLGGPETSGSLISGVEVGGIGFFNSPFDSTGRLGLLFVNRNLFEDDGTVSHLGVGLSVGFAYSVISQRRSGRLFRSSRALSVGILAQGELTFVQGEPHGWLTFPIVLEFFGGSGPG